MAVLALAAVNLLGDRAGAQGDALARGEAIFKSSCFACHTIGQGRLVGPDLRGVEERRDEAWLIAFVQNSQAVVESGDPVAVALFEEYARIQMPPQPLSEEEVRAVLAFVRASAPLGPAAAVQVGVATPEQIVLGQQLFQGKVRLANGGPTCNSCHDVVHDAVIGGGVLARELTTVFTRLGGGGVRAVIGSPPFPVMQRAYQGRPLTEEEVTALVAFLQDADAKQALHRPRDYGVRLFSAGVLGAAALLGLYALAWRRRRFRTVYQPIFDRQIRSR